MKNTYLAIIALFCTALPIEALAVPQVMRRDLKLPSQQMIEKLSIANPIVAGTANLLSAYAGATSAAAASTSTFLAQPDVARNLVITPGGTTADVAACVITVSGLNVHSVAISETFTFTNNQSTAVVGSKAFKTVSLVSLPANCEDGGFAATWSVGFGEKLGLNHCMAQAGHILFSTLNGAKEATAPTMAASAAAVESNTADFNGTMDGVNDFELFYIQNFQCP